MNILLTGASGFLGQHLVDKIANEIDKINEANNYEATKLYQLFEFSFENCGSELIYNKL